MAKTVNYTDEMTTELVAAYTAADSDEARASVVATYAEKFEKKVQSIRQKLSREGVYVKKARTTKNGEEIVKKEDLVSRIAEAMGVEAEAFESLAKANKNVLLKLAEHFEE